MYISECIVYEPAEVSVKSVDGSPALQISVPGKYLVNLTMSRAQLERLLESGEWWMEKNELPDCVECGHNKPEYAPTDRGNIPDQRHCEKDETPDECGEETRFETTS